MHKVEEKKASKNESSIHFVENKESCGRRAAAAQWSAGKLKKAAVGCDHWTELTTTIYILVLLLLWYVCPLYQKVFHSPSLISFCVGWFFNQLVVHDVCAPLLLLSQVFIPHQCLLSLPTED